MATKKTSASKASRKAASKKPKAKAASKKGTAKKLAPAKTAAKKAPAKKIAAKKAAAKKPVLKKAAVKKSAAKKTVIKKTATKKSPAKKAAIKKAISAKKPAKIVSKKAAAKKPVAQKPVTKKAVSKPAVKTQAPSKTPAKKVPAKKPILKPSATAARKAAAIKRVRTAAKVPPRKNALKPNQPPVTPVRRPASAALRTKTASGTMTKLAGAVRVPVLPSSVSRRAARSAARGLAPTPAAASAQEAKARTLSDEPLSEQKLREHIRTAVLYLEAWLRSSGADVSPAVAELAAPAEAARAQVWRWLDREARFDDSRIMTAAFLEETLHQEMQLLRDDMGHEAYDAGLFATAAPLFLDSALAPDFADFPMSAAKLLD